MRAIPTLSLILLAACGGSTAPAEPVPSAGEEAPPPPPVNIDGVAWKDMDGPQKGKFMNEVVVPTMKDIFVAHDPAYGESFGCQTCHGDNGSDVGFKMPNGLSPIDPKAFPTPASPDENVAKWASFMFQKVTPKMVELLGEQPYDMEANTGFGCFGCHGKVE